jgi:potassium channel subfamily K member 18
VNRDEKIQIMVKICREDDWKSMARTRLRKFEEELQTAIESGMHSYSGHNQWNFVNAVLYCLDLCTTIGEAK